MHIPRKPHSVKSYFSGMNKPAILVCPFVVFSWISMSLAHDVDLTRVRVTLREDRSYQVDVFYDVNAHLINVRPEHLTEADLDALRALPAAELDRRMAELRDYALRRLRIYFDDKRTSFVAAAVDVEPVFAASSQPTSDHATAMTRILRLTGQGPPDAKEFVFWASKSFGNIVLEFTSPEGRLIDQQMVEQTARSRPFNMERLHEELSTWRVALNYAVLGFEHILPYGLDHILFVLGLFLLSTRLAPLLWQVTAFTVAHSVTLALSTYGVIRLSPSIVEPLIAMSIAYVAIENICTTRLHFWRPLIVFCFGLLHGMGFAGVLEELGLPRDRFVTALVSFNFGVELGQVAVILLALAVVGWFRGRPWYRGRIVVPASVVIAAFGVYWSVERLEIFG